MKTITLVSLCGCVLASCVHLKSANWHDHHKPFGVPPQRPFIGAPIKGNICTVACEVVDTVACDTGCACLVCPAVDADELRSNCTESVRECAGNINYLQIHGEDGYDGQVALLSSNEYYRIVDLVEGKSDTWRAASIAMICNPVFRGTLMREMVRNSTLLHGENLPLDGVDMEYAVTSALDEGGKGFACSTGTGPAELNMDPSAEQQRLGQLENMLRQRWDQGLCNTSGPDQFVVLLRMGDVFPTFEDVTDGVDRYLAATPGIKLIIFSGVMHFSGFVGMFDGVADDNRTGANVDLLRRLRKHAHDRGYQSSIRSQPVVDDDLCFLQHAPHLVSIESAHHKGGFGSFVYKLRRLKETLDNAVAS